MKVLLQNRSNFRESIAGDSIQINKTKEYLNGLGVQADISSSPNLDLGRYDLVHLFNIMPVEETYRQFQNARRQHKKVIISTIYWDPVEFLNTSRQMETFGEWWRNTNQLRCELMAEAAMILPNSIMELRVLEHDFGKVPPATIIPNAADRVFADASPVRFVQRYRLKDYLLSVGRICQRKNQLMLIRAARKLNLPLVLIGPINDGLYYRECRREAAGHKVSFFDSMTHLDLASAYAAARVHALVSWYDTPGLASLEAALTGSQIVSTDRGSAFEYFGEKAFYCNPGNIESISEAIQTAWRSPQQSDLKAKVLQNYTWERTASKTLEAYHAVL